MLRAIDSDDFFVLLDSLSQDVADYLNEDLSVGLEFDESDGEVRIDLSTYPPYLRPVVPDELFFDVDVYASYVDSDELKQHIQNEIEGALRIKGYVSVNQEVHKILVYER